MPEHMIDCKVTQVKMISEGVSDPKPPKKVGAPWQMYKIKTDSTLWEGEEFTYFFSPGGKKPAPFVGMVIKHVELHEGEYKGNPQWTMKKFDSIDETPPDVGVREPVAQAAGQTRAGDSGSPVSMYVSYAKDLWVAAQVSGSNKTVSDAIEEVVKGALQLKGFAENPDAFRAYIAKKGNIDE